MNTMRERLFIVAASCLIVSGVIIPIFGGVLIFGPEAESELFPVMQGYQITEQWAEGPDLIVKGKAAKVRGCEREGPTQGVDEAGVTYVIWSRNPNQNLNWTPSPIKRHMGPWVIPNGVGHVVHMSMRHECHPLWNVYSTLGAVDGRAQ